MAADPFRGSAHRAVIGAYLAEGNQRAAVRQFQILRRLLADELVVAPSAQLAALVGVVAAPGTPGARRRREGMGGLAIGMGG